MKTKTDARHERMSAEERREAVLDAAVAEFAAHGLHGTSTEAIAARAGISQPYVFRLFGTKKELFIAAVERVYAIISDGFRRAADAHPDDVLEQLGRSYSVLLTRRDELLILLHSFAAAEDPDVRRAVRRHFAELYRYVQTVSGASDDEVRAFFAKGMLMTIAAAIRAPEMLLNDDWVRECLGLDPDSFAER